MAQDSLKTKSLYAIIWSFLLQFARNFGTFIISVVLARLLVPADYGLISLQYIFFWIAGMLAGGGLNVILVRQKEVTEEEYSSAFWYNLTTAMLCYLLVVAASPFIAQFFNAPKLTKILYINALTIPLNALTIVPDVKLKRALKQKQLAIRSVICSLAGGLVAIAFAFHGFGVWSLVFQQLITAFLNIIILFHITKWVPNHGFRFDLIKGVLKSGAYVLFSNIAWTLFDNVYNLLIGKFYDITSLGVYNKGKYYGKYYPGTIAVSINEIMLPSLAKIQDDKQRLKSAYAKSLQLGLCATFFPCLMLCALARPLVLLAFGEKWETLIPFLRIMSFAFMLMPIQYGVQQITLIKGRADNFFKVEQLKNGILLLAAAIGVWFGVLHLAVAETVANLLNAFISLSFSSYFLKMRRKELIQPLIPMFLRAVMCAVSAWFLADICLWSHKNVYALLTGSFVGLALFVGVCRIFKTREVTLVIEILILLKKKVNTSLIIRLLGRQNA